MSTTYEQATDDIFGLITKTSNLFGNSLIGYQPEIRYQGVPESTKPATDKVWIRISIQTVSQPQRTLSTCVGAPGQRKYSTYGLIFIQVFIPRLNGAWPKGTKYANKLRDAFRGYKSGNGVWFRNARVEELPQEAEFFRINVVSEFEYSEIY